MFELLSSESFRTVDACTLFKVDLDKLDNMLAAHQRESHYHRMIELLAREESEGKTKDSHVANT